MHPHLYLTLILLLLSKYLILILLLHQPKEVQPAALRQRGANTLTLIQHDVTLQGEQLEHT